MLIGVTRESRDGETRVSATPATVRQLIKLGYQVVVEPGAGAAASFTDQAYVDAGANLGDPWAADIVLKINAPTAEEQARLRDGATLISLLSPALKPELVDALTQRPITAIAMDAVPRISRAQSIDVLSSMANIAGYRAVIEAAHAFGRFFTGQVTAAGKIPPAKVLVAGAGVAGLAAIGASVSLGAIVRATDPRPEVADEVKSLGGEYLAVDVEVERSVDGYAKATSEEYDRRAAEIYAAQCKEVDIVITTALIPGRPAPRLLTEEHVASMKPGSVIVDMAAAQGGNVAGSKPDEVVVTPNGVTIIGYTDLPGRLPAQASQLYGNNLVNLFKMLTPGKDGQLALNLDDVVQRSMTVVHNGQKLWPPPPVAVSAAPKAAAAAAAPKVAAAAEKKPMSTAKLSTLIGLGALALFLLTAFAGNIGVQPGAEDAPSQLIINITVFVLAVVIGYYVIGNVHHALHTPLMSVTNAISGVIIVGALMQVGSENVLIRAVSVAAILLACINIFGGFAVTRRMLSMFKKG